MIIGQLNSVIAFSNVSWAASSYYQITVLFTASYTAAFTISKVSMVNVKIKKLPNKIKLLPNSPYQQTVL